MCCPVPQATDMFSLKEARTSTKALRTMSHGNTAGPTWACPTLPVRFSKHTHADLF